LSEAYKELSWFVYFVGAFISLGMMLLEHFTKTAYVQLKDKEEEGNEQRELILKNQKTIDKSQDKIYQITEEYVNTGIQHRKQLDRIEQKTDSINDNFTNLKHRVTLVEQEIYDIKADKNKLKVLVKENSEAISRIDRKCKKTHN
jgi:chromosome segregation ATPase